MNPTQKTKCLLIPLALALALGVGYAPAQTIHVGGDGVIGDTVLTTTGGTALVGVTGASWKTDGGTGSPVSSTLISPAVAVPTTGNVTLTFTHRYDFESGWDGGAVLVSINGNPAVYLNGAAFTSNGYVGTTTANSSAAWAGGESVFYGQSAGYTTPALVTSVANLGLLNAGDTVSVQFKGEWDQGTTNGPPAWEIGTVKLTDSGATDFLNANFATGGSSGFTVVDGGTLIGTLAPWVYSLQTAVSNFEINGDTQTADRYVPDSPGAVLDLSNATMVVELLAGTLDGGEVFSLFDLSGGTTLTGTPTSITLLPPGVWDTSKLATEGTITFVSPPPTLTWNLTGPGDGIWDEATENWTDDGGTTTTAFTPGAKVIFDKADGGIITVVGMTPASMTVNSAGNYTFQVALTPGVPSILGGTLTKNGSGILRLGDAAWANTANAGTYKNDFTTVQINAGTVYYGSRNAFGTGTVTLEGGTALRKFGEEGNGAALTMANNLVVNGEVNMHIQFSSFKDQWFSGQISGPGSITVTGERRALTLAGDNSFTGGVIMENYIGTGTVSLYNLDIGHANALGTGTLTVRTALLSGLTQFRGLGASLNLTADSGVTNDVVIDTGATFYVGRGQNLRLSGDISGAGGLFKRNTTTVILDGANTYGGGTRIDNGILTINGSLADASMNIVGGTVDGTGTLTFNIDGAAADQIAMTGGTLTATELNLAVNPTGSGLTEPEYVLVSATGGTITGTFASITGAPNYELNYDTPNQVKLVKIGGTSPYDTWSGGAAADLDTNGDGVDNGVAWALGATGPNVDAIGLLPTLDNKTDPDYVIFTFSRSDAAEADTNTAITVQYGTDLVNWTTAVDNDDIDIMVTDGTPNDTVSVKLKRSTLGASGKFFVRLKAVVTP